jgi:hypothetical protein
MFKMNWSALPALAFAVAAVTAGPANAAPITLQIQNSGTAMLITKPDGQVEYQEPELDPGLEALEGTEADLAGMFKSGGKVINRSIAKGSGIGAATTSSKKAKSNPELILTVDGLNFRQQRLANGGNQFSVEPPDQALCAGNGYVLEAVNDVLRVFSSSGTALSGVVDLNTFYGYAPAITRTASPLRFGPSITDPVCHYDADTQRWFVVVLTLDRAIPTSQNLSGKNHLDIAVSTTSNPLGTWRVYRLPVQNDGTDGTPTHSACPCIGDYPHIGMDATGLYLTTNEFPFAGGFNGAQIYAMSKRALAAGASTINVALINTADSGYLLDGAPGFTVWPAISPDASSFSSAQGGTEFFMSSQAVFNDSGTDNRIRVWALSNTTSLDTATPNLSLIHNTVTVDAYAVPDVATQRTGDYPQGQLAGAPLGVIDGNDSRIQQVSFANGTLWGALDTAVAVGGQQRVGIAYYAINPQLGSGGLKGKVVKQGKLALAGNHLTRPAVAVLGNGRGVIGFTVTGADYYPSAGYVGLDALAGAGDVHIASAGLGPQDGFTEYSGRPRWGDYGAAATDGKSIWVATEYVNQTCTVATYLATAGSCGGTRTSLGNWGTRITKVTP